MKASSLRLLSLICLKNAISLIEAQQGMSEAINTLWKRSNQGTKLRNESNKTKENKNSKRISDLFHNTVGYSHRHPTVL